LMGFASLNPSHTHCSKLRTLQHFRNCRGILPLSVTDQFRFIFNAKCRLNLYAFR